MMVLAPLVALGSVELGLRLTGYGVPTEFFLKTDDGKFLVSNPRYCWQFFDPNIATRPHPLLMPAVKQPGVRRIFVLGESAAEGAPDPDFGFSRVLEVMLKDRHPDQRFEVVNAAVRGINSHVIALIMRECARYEPDLFLIYMGNNEIIGLYSPEPGRFNFSKWPTLIQVRQWARRMRVGQLLMSAAIHFGPKTKPTQDMEYFRRVRLAADDPDREPVHENFERNLNAICDMAGRTPVALCSMCVNLRDCPPINSMRRRDLTLADKTRWEKARAAGTAAQVQHRFEEALRFFDEAAAIDDHYAELRFRRAQCLLELGQPEKARQEFIAARDWDALQFRADNRINAILRKTAANRAQNGVFFCDVEQALAASPSSLAGAPGAPYFIDANHFTFDGNWMAARAQLPVVERALGIEAPASAPLSRAECAARLGLTLRDECNLAEAFLDAINAPPFLDQIDHDLKVRQTREAWDRAVHQLDIAGAAPIIDAYRKATAGQPSDWRIRVRFGEFLADLKDHRGAADQYAELAKIYPYSAAFQIRCAQELAYLGRSAEAAAHIETAARLDPGIPAVREAQSWAKKALTISSPQ